MDLRTVEIEGKPWFVAADVCRCLGLRTSKRGQVNVTEACRSLKADESCFRRIETDSKTRTAFVRLISESGLYKLIMRSDKPEARTFQDWVTRDVLPAIRKDGAYVIGEEKVAAGEMTEEELISKALLAVHAKAERLAAELAR